MDFRVDERVNLKKKFNSFLVKSLRGHNIVKLDPSIQKDRVLRSFVLENRSLLRALDKNKALDKNN